MREYWERATEIGAILVKPSRTGLRLRSPLDRLSVGRCPRPADVRHADGLGDPRRLRHRRDHDRDGAYGRAQAAAIIDAWWPLLVDSIFQVSDSRRADVLLRERFGLSADEANRTRPRGLGLPGGMYPHVQKDLRQVIEDSLGGDAVAARFSRTYCGAGVLADCRTALWSSLETAIPELETKYGSTNESDWNFDPAEEEMRHSAVGIAGTAAALFAHDPLDQPPHLPAGGPGRDPRAEALRSQRP